MSYAMQTTFDCPCGASVSAAGAWADEHEADIFEVCGNCSRQFVLTYKAWEAGPDTPKETSNPGDTPERDAANDREKVTSCPLEVGETAPDFELPGVDEDGIDTFRLSDYTESGPVLLSFYPFDFSPVCESQLCRFRDIEWVRVAEDTDVFAISGDSTYSHRAFREANNFQFPALSSLAPPQLAFVRRAIGAVVVRCSIARSEKSNGGRSADCRPTSDGSGRCAA